MAKERGFGQACSLGDLRAVVELYPRSPNNSTAACSSLPLASGSHRAMRVFITGASGWIGATLTTQLVAGGHEVVGLARSQASAETVVTAGLPFTSAMRVACSS